MARLRFKPLEVVLPLMTVYGNLADGGPAAGADAEELQVRASCQDTRKNVMLVPKAPPSFRAVSPRSTRRQRAAT